MTLLDRHITVDGVRLAYRHATARHEDPLVFLHGTPSHSFIWRNVIPDLEARHDVLAYDLLGFGDSERPLERDTSVTAQADLLGALLDRLGIRRCTLIAHDIGGAIAQIFATRQRDRVRTMMLIDSVSYDSWPSETWQRIIRDDLDDYATMSQPEFDAMLTRQLRMTVADPARMSGEALDAYLAPHRGALGRMSFFEHQVRHYDARATQEVAAALKTLPMTVRVLWGELDRWQPLDYGRRLARDIPDADLVTVPDAGHFLMEDQPQRVIDEVERLLAT